MIPGITHRSIRWKGSRSSMEVESCMAVGAVVSEGTTIRQPRAVRHKHKYRRALCCGCDREVAVDNGNRYLFHGTVVDGSRSPNGWDRSVARLDR